MTTLDRCLESLAFCHLQDELLWASARIVVEQDIDEFVRESAPDLEGKLEALRRLMQGFEQRFAGETDPVLILSTMRRHIRRIEFDLKRESDLRKQFNEIDALTESPTTAPEAHLEEQGVTAAHDAPDEVVTLAGHQVEHGDADSRPAIQAVVEQEPVPRDAAASPVRD